MQYSEMGAWLRMCSVAISDADALSRLDLVRLASSSRKAAIRVTGGAGLTSEADGRDLADFLAQALGGAACDASILAGATMNINRPTPGFCRGCDVARTHCRRHSADAVEDNRRPGVMDVLSRLEQLKAPARTIGVVPTLTAPRLRGGFIIVVNKRNEPYYTVVDEQAPVCLLVQYNTDRPDLTWDDEWRICIDYLELLRQQGEQQSLHLVYNGGDATENEIEHVAKLSLVEHQPWPMLLVEDSGRAATTYANNTAWRKEHPHVESCKKDELRTVIRQMGFAP